MSAPQTEISPLNGTLIQPGDQLVTTCTYNTQGLTAAVGFGFGYDEEMCFTYLAYWPAQKMTRCTHMPGIQNLAWCRDGASQTAFGNQATKIMVSGVTGG
jgi:Copper type II ascorbate-dependent monooxygenase, C-terminal domain